MTREIQPLAGPVSASIRVPGSKSLTNRALICAALAKGESTIINPSDSADTALMANGLNQLGVLALKRDSLVVAGTGGTLYAPKFPIPVGNAGTTLRFIMSLAAIARGNTILEGSIRMGERPIEDLQNALADLGTRLEVKQSRFIVHGGTFKGGRVSVSGQKSSQFLSSLLLIAPYATQTIGIDVADELVSSPYADMTVHTMRQFGVSVERHSAKSFVVPAGQRYTPTTYSVEPDSSGASYFFSAAAICRGEVFVEGVYRKSLQGDLMYLDVLEKMGCSVLEETTGTRVRCDQNLRGVDVDLNSMPDMVPTLAVTALFAAGKTRIRNVAHLRHKESDRLQALEDELRSIGAQVSTHEDGLEITPAPLHGAQLNTYDDHRLAMSFALIGLRTEGITIENPNCVKKSFPTFWTKFNKLYGN